MSSVFRFELVTNLISNFRVKVTVVDDVVGEADATIKRDAEKLAALAACYEIVAKGLVR